MKMFATSLFLSLFAVARASSNPAWGGTASSIHRRPRSAVEFMSDLFGLPHNSNALYRQQQRHKTRTRYSEEGDANEGSNAKGTFSFTDGDAEDTKEQDTTTTGISAITYSPRYSIYQGEDDTVELSIEIPGVEPNDLSIEIEDGSSLHVKGSRLVRTGDDGKWEVAAFDEVFDVESTTDVENISVNLSRGILRIVAPKKKKTVRKISIRLDEDGEAAKKNKEENCDKDECKPRPTLSRSEAFRELRAILVEENDNNKDADVAIWDDDDMDERAWE